MSGFTRSTRLPGDGRRVLITGGAGFIGANLADRLASNGAFVIIFDNLSRHGVENNVRWLRSRHRDRIQVEIADVRNAGRVKSAVQSVDQVFHLAAQVAVTSSLLNPRYDSEVNIGGTLNVLEATRSLATPPGLLFTSTNKVYGDLPSLKVRKTSTRYEAADSDTRRGINEDTPLSFHSPYGCSKGAADQYVLDYSRSFGLPAAVFRMSCIYGPHQMGTEDQGWIAHFIRQAIQNQPITICGDGLQVRDTLFIDDLLDAFLLAQDNISSISGQAFNIGGGPGHTISLIELLSTIESLQGRRPRIQMDDWRQGDQRYYVSDTSKFRSAVGWLPKVGVASGIRRLYEWLTLAGPSLSDAQLGGEHAVLAS